jgi:hypothetical protein
MNVGKVTMTVDTAKLKAKLEKAVNTGVYQAALVYEAFIKDSFTKTPVGTHSAPGQPPGTQTNNLRKSVTALPPKNGRSIIHTSKIKYAAMMEFGGTVRAKGGKFLPVPLNNEAKRLQAKAIGGLKNSPVPLHIVRTKTGRLFLVKHLTRKGKNATKLLGSQMMFILKKSVTIAARPYMRPAEQNAALYVKATDAFAAGVKQVLSKGAA